MIDPKELRLGNYILSRETREPQTVTAIGDDYVCFDVITFYYTDIEDVDPLPLTDEYWLLFGFKKYDNLYYKGNFNVEQHRFDFVHELQNYYFATNKEEVI